MTTTRLVFKHNKEEIYYEAEAEMLQRAMFLAGYAVSLYDVHLAWREYSDSMAAGWLTIDSYSCDDLVAILTDYLEEEE